jgi:hypothetical protein
MQRWVCLTVFIFLSGMPSLAQAVSCSDAHNRCLRMCASKSAIGPRECSFRCQRAATACNFSGCWRKLDGTRVCRPHQGLMLTATRPVVDRAFAPRSSQPANLLIGAHGILP